MKKNITGRHLNLVDAETKQPIEGVITLQEAKGYLPKYFSTFVKDRKDFRKLSVGARDFLTDLYSMMRKGNVLIMSGVELAQELRLPLSTVYRYLKQLDKHDFLRSNGNYKILNPKYALNGGRAYYVQAHHEYSMLAKSVRK